MDTPCTNGQSSRHSISPSVNPESGTLDQLCNKITRFGHFFFWILPHTLGITWPMKEVIPQQFPQHRIQCTKTKKLLQSRGSTWLSGGACGSNLAKCMSEEKIKIGMDQNLCFSIFFGNEMSMSHRFLNSLGYRVLSQSRGVKTRLLQHWADSSSH